jgi:hypothetical protein
MMRPGKPQTRNTRFSYGYRPKEARLAEKNALPWAPIAALQTQESRFGGSQPHGLIRCYQPALPPLRGISTPTGPKLFPGAE